MSQRMQQIDGAEDARPEGEGTNRPAGEILSPSPSDGLGRRRIEEYALFSVI